MAKADGEHRGRCVFEDPEKLRAMRGRRHQAGRGARRGGPKAGPHAVDSMTRSASAIATSGRRPAGSLGACRDEDAPRHQRASRLPDGEQKPMSDGGATVAPPSVGNGKTLEQTALAARGQKSHTSVERSSDLQRGTNSPRAKREGRRRPQFTAGRARAQIGRCRHGGGTVGRHDITTLPVLQPLAHAREMLGGLRGNPASFHRQGHLGEVSNSIESIEVHSPEHSHRRTRRDHLFHYASTETATGGAHP